MQYTNTPVFQSLNHLPAIQVSSEVEANTPHKPIALQVSQARPSENWKWLPVSPVVKADQHRLLLWSKTEVPNMSIQDAATLNSHLTVAANG